MKKLMTTIFLTALFMLCAIGLAACENGNTTGINIKSVQGEKGEKGDDGTGIKNIEIDSDGNLIVTLTDDKTINAGNVKLGHPHEIKEKEVVISEPTCNTMGLKYVICETCGEVVKTILTEHTVHSILNENETCEHCGWTVTSKKGDNFLMENDNGELKAEFYGKKFYDFGDDVRDKYVSVYIGEKITEIDDKAFLGCKELTSITVNENNKKYQSIDGNLYSKDGKSLIKYAIGKTDTKFIIPKGVVNIGYAAFNECSSLKEIVIPDTVETIERGAFRKTGITSIVIPDSVTSIGGVLLAECSELRTAVLGKGVTVLTESMFFKCQN